MDQMCCDLEVKFAADDASGKFSGYGAVFNNVDGGGDVIIGGAFKRTLREWEGKGKFPPMLLQHGGWGTNADDLLPIGRWTAMEETARGLKVTGELFALGTERGTYIHEGLKSGALDGLSIGYRVKKFTQGTKPTEPRRKLEDIDLVEVSVVTFPMNDKARVNAVKFDELQTVREVEAYLRDACGMPRRQAAALIARIKGLDPRRDADDEQDLAGLLEQVQRLRSVFSR